MWQKLTDIRSEVVHRWLDRKSCTKRELKSLLGHLSHINHMVKPGKTFIYATPIRDTDRNPTGSLPCPPECFDSFRHPVVVHICGRVKWGENDSTSVDTINKDLVRCVRILIRVLGSMPNAIKVDTTAVNSRTRGNESWGGGQYNVDGIATYPLS